MTAIIKDWFCKPFDTQDLLAGGIGPIAFKPIPRRAVGTRYGIDAIDGDDFLKIAQNRDWKIAVKALCATVLSHGVTNDEATELITMSPVTWCYEQKQVTKGIEFMQDLIEAVVRLAPNAHIPIYFLWRDLQSVFDACNNVYQEKDFDTRQWRTLQELRKLNRIPNPADLRKAFPGWRTQALYDKKLPRSAREDKGEHHTLPGDGTSGQGDGMDEVDEGDEEIA